MPSETYKSDQDATCELTEDNIIGHDRLTNTPAECQAQCIQNADCTWFTHFETECYLLRDCGHTEQ